jgi:hypothetical protein
MNRTAFLPLFLLLAASFLAQDSRSCAQVAPTPSTSRFASLQGIVVKDPGSEPLKKTLIELIAESPGDGGNHTALTGLDGGFRIENIVPGRYRLFVERTGYQENDKRHHRTDGRVLTLTDGQQLTDVVIRLEAAAVIDGRVTDEDGDPMAEAQVAVLRQTFVAGRTHWEQARAERTNDLGEYRIPGLPAGNYFVSVTPPPDFRSLIETASTPPAAASHGVANDKPVPTAYQTTYYPGTRDRAQAGMIQLHAGDDFPINFSLTPGPSLTIRGSVLNVPAGSTAAITLQSEEFNMVLNGAEMHKDGSFEIRDVAPGAYTILATVDNAAVPMAARQSLQITSANVDGLRLAPQAGGTVRGRLRMEASGNAQPDPSQMFLLLRSADGEENGSGFFGTGDQLFSTLAHVNGDGSFEWKNVPAGRYSVEISDVSAIPDWYLKSAAAAGRDVLEAGVNVSGGATALDLIASMNGAAAEGLVSNDKGEAVGDAIVVAVPEPRLRNRPDRYRKAMSDQSGRFSLRGLPAGDYTIYAWETVESEAYYNAEFLKGYEGQGKVVHLSEGERASLKIRSIPAAQDE